MGLEEINTALVLEQLSSEMERKIAKMLALKSEKVHIDGWWIVEKETPDSTRLLFMSPNYKTKEEALAQLQSICSVVPADETLKKRFFPDEPFVYQATTAIMKGSPKGEPIPRVFCLSHSVFDGLMSDPDKLNISDENIEVMKTAYLTFRKAEIYDRCMREFWKKHFDPKYSLSHTIQREMNKLLDEVKDKDWGAGVQHKGQ